MINERDLLWPYGRTLALVALPVILIVAFGVFTMARTHGIWPNEWSGAAIAYIVFVIGLIPLLLVLIDFISSKRAMVDIKGFKIDFGRVDLTQPDISADSFGLPDNIGITGAIVTDTTPMKIVAALAHAIDHEVVIVDIKSGDAWWATRLLALSAGAVRAGSPKAFVFLGVKENVQAVFLGWATPIDVQNAILRDKSEYRTVFEKALRIARQLELFGDPGLLPLGFTLHADVSRYASPEFTALGNAAFEQILMDQLGMVVFAPDPRSLEDPPDRVTLGRLLHLFGHCLFQDKVDLTSPKEAQITEFLDSRSDYVALIRGGRYQSMLKREEGERVVIKGLLLQAQQSKASYA